MEVARQQAVEESGPSRSRHYSRGFFSGQKDGSRLAAERVVPMVLELCEPRSVVDVGCGVGTWAGVFHEMGVEDVIGVDGDYVPRDMLRMSRENFRAADLSKALDLGRRFDLAVSLEVAEHLAPEVGEGFVDSLTGLAPVVLFSAAIPLQGGKHHVNERPQSYWAGLFKARGYETVDVIRARIWGEEECPYWYQQNMLIYASGEGLERLPRLRAAREASAGRMPLDVVHPRLLELRNRLPKTNPLVMGWLASRVVMDKAMRRMGIQVKARRGGAGVG